jgi:hypothetical protein
MNKPIPIRDDRTLDRRDIGVGRFDAKSPPKR